MDDLTSSTLDLMLGHSLTRHPVDNRRAVLAIRAIGPAAVPMIIAKRAAWLRYLTVRQRAWQSGTRNPNKARHHDSIEIRERYVRGDR